MKSASLALLAAATVFAAACSPDGAASGTLSPTHPRMVITTSTVTCPDTISVGQSAQCVAYFYDENHNLVSTTPTWSTPTGTLISVNSTGSITGLAVGSATVQASSGGVTGSKGVYVKPGLSTSIVGQSPVQRYATCSWYVSVSGGTAPYSYQWTASGASGTDNGYYWSGALISAQATLTAKVTDANGVQKTVSRVIQASLSAPAC